MMKKPKDTNENVEETFGKDQLTKSEIMQLDDIARRTYVGKMPKKEVRRLISGIMLGNLNQKP